MSPPLESKRPYTDDGRILAIDMGEKRIGIAVSDPLRLIARSYTVLERRSRREDFARIGEIIDREGVDLVVMGLPINLSGDEGNKAAWIRDYAGELARELAIELLFWDESFTTVQAAESMRARGKNARQQKEWIDAVAAAFILQSYLDATHAGGPPAPLPPEAGQ